MGVYVGPTERGREDVMRTQNIDRIFGWSVMASGALYACFLLLNQIQHDAMEAGALYCVNDTYWVP